MTVFAAAALRADWPTVLRWGGSGGMMNVSIILVSAGLLVPALVACGGKEDDDVGGANTQALCEQGCATTASLSCPRADTCVADCQQLASTLKTALPNCGAQIDAFAQCVSIRPVEDFECVSDGTAAPRANVCADEQAAVFACAMGG
jgi:hypothetical protein